MLRPDFNDRFEDKDEELTSAKFAIFDYLIEELREEFEPFLPNKPAFRTFKASLNQILAEIKEKHDHFLTDDFKTLKNYGEEIDDSFINELYKEL